MRSVIYQNSLSVRYVIYNRFLTNCSDNNLITLKGHKILRVTHLIPGHVIFGDFVTSYQPIGQFRYLNILSWLRGLGEYNKRNELFIPHPRCDFFCLIPLSLGAKLEF